MDKNSTVIVGKLGKNRAINITFIYLNLNQIQSRDSATDIFYHSIYIVFLIFVQLK